MGGAAISKSDEFCVSGFGSVFAETGLPYCGFAVGKTAVGTSAVFDRKRLACLVPCAARHRRVPRFCLWQSVGDLSLDVMDFVGSSVLRAFGECLGAQRR